MHPKFKDGSSVAWLFNDVVRYGVVVRGTESSVDVVPVYRLAKGIKCYDEGGSDSVSDKNNVLLRDCPPPFSELCAQVEKNACYVLAAVDACCTMREDEILSTGFDFMRDGTHISDRDFADALDHFWRDEKEHGIGFKQETFSRSPKMAALFRMHDPDEGPEGPGGSDGPDF